MFSVSFQTASVAVAQIFAMGALGFYLIRSGIIQEAGLKLLSFLSVNVFFPLFIFNQIIKNFDVSRIPFWWGFPLINISLTLTGLSITWAIIQHRRNSFKDVFLVTSSLHNAGYIPILMVASLPLGVLAGPVYTCVILSIIGFDTCLWSIGVWLMTRSRSSKMDLRRMINPPLISMSLALILSIIGAQSLMPELILKPIKILGDAAMGMAMLVIGGNLALCNLKQIAWMELSGVVLIKLVILPMIALVVLSILKLNPLLSFVAILQACMPTSITLSIIGRNYETQNQDFVNQAIFMTHLLSMITIPIFLGLYGRLM